MEAGIKGVPLTVDSVFLTWIASLFWVAFLVMELVSTTHHQTNDSSDWERIWICSASTTWSFPGAVNHLRRQHLELHRCAVACFVKQRQ